jgi:chorismate mutase
MSEEKRLFALRGAVQCLNEAQDMQKHIIILYEELLRRNNLNESELVSVFFSVTRDLDAKNPASALREGGRAGETALFVNQEAHFPGSLERVIRLLIHCYLDISQIPVHVYCNGAELLRPDRKQG